MSQRGALWMLIYLGLILLPLVVLLTGEIPPSRGFWRDFSVGLGFAAMAMIAAQFALTARFRRASAPFGIDILYYFHRVLAIGALGIVLGHWGILFAGFRDEMGAINPLEAPWELTAGRLALGCFAALVVTSEFRKPLRLKYEWWRYLHVGLAVVGFAAAVAHITGIGYYTEAPAKRVLWLAVTGGWLGLLAWVRIGKPAQQRRTPWKVAENRPERAGARTLVLEPDGHPGLAGFKPGQFAWITLRRSPYLLREHPFSMASAPEDGPRLAFSIKPAGDFTSTIDTIEPGETAYLDGPYGVFSIDGQEDAPRLVFVAGGIGITPIMSNLRAMAARGDRRPAVLFYCNVGWDDIVFREEIEALAETLDLKVVHVLEKPPEGWEGESGYFDRAILERHLRDEPGRHECFLCGPPPMTDAAREALIRLGVPARRIHSELFELV